MVTILMASAIGNFRNISCSASLRLPDCIFFLMALLIRVTQVTQLKCLDAFGVIYPAIVTLILLGNEVHRKFNQNHASSYFVL